MGRRTQAVYFLISGAVMFWLGYALVDSWVESLALGPALIMIAVMIGHVGKLLDERTSIEHQHAQFSEQHREMLAELEHAQLRVRALELMGIHVVWMSARELEQLVERVKAGQKASPQLSKWVGARKRLAFLPMRGLDEETARVWPLNTAEAERLSRGVPRLETIVRQRSKSLFAPALADDELSRPRA